MMKVGSNLTTNIMEHNTEGQIFIPNFDQIKTIRRINESILKFYTYQRSLMKILLKLVDKYDLPNATLNRILIQDHSYNIFGAKLGRLEQKALLLKIGAKNVDILIANKKAALEEIFMQFIQCVKDENIIGIKQCYEKGLKHLDRPLIVYDGKGGTHYTHLIIRKPQSTFVDIVQLPWYGLIAFVFVAGIMMFFLGN